MRPYTIGVLGLGKLGLPAALVFAEAGHRVLVWDTDPDVRDAVRERRSPIEEPLVTEMLSELELQIAAPGFMAEVADLILLVVPTPSKRDGSFDVGFVAEAIGSLKPSARRGSAAPLVLSLVSTVSPGSCRVLAQIAAQRHMDLVYTPTMIALGSVVHDLQQAEVQIIGWNNEPAGNFAARLWRTVAPASPAVRMSYESAEIAKLASNAFSTLKIAFANALGQWCEAYEHVDVDDVVEALEHRSHIGRHLITPGAGFGGPCLPRDTRAVAAAGFGLGAYVHELNRRHLGYVVSQAINDYVAAHDQRGPATFAVLGREYKDGANHRIASFGDRLHDRFVDTYNLEPVNAREADIVIISMPLHGINLCTEIKPGAVVYDLWRTHRYLTDCSVTYRALGVSP